MTADVPPDGLHHRECSGESEPAAEQQTVIFFRGWGGGLVGNTLIMTEPPNHNAAYTGVPKHLIQKKKEKKKKRVEFVKLSDLRLSNPVLLN